MGRKCAVPHCYTGYRKCTEKASLYRVPNDDFFLSKWQEAIAREDRPITPKDFVCEKHFKDDDILRTRIIKDVVEQYQRPRLKPDAVPSIFPDLPEFITKMVKKRRKMSVDDTNSFEMCSVLKNEDESVTEQNVMKIEIKTEPLEANYTENLAGTASEIILSNELDIKSESEENTEHQIENCEEHDENSVKPNMHRCEECGYETKYPHNLNSHKVKHLTGDDAYIRCEFCSNFKTKWGLSYRNHLKSKHAIGREETFKCMMCPFESKTKSSLKSHTKQHQNLEDSGIVKKIVYKCLKCPYKTEEKNNLLIHVIEHESTMDEAKYAIWRCLRCAFVTFYQRQQTQCGNELFVCKNCGFKYEEKRKEIKEVPEFVAIKNEVSHTGCDYF